MTNDEQVLDDAVTKMVEGKSDFVDALEKDNADNIVKSVIDAIEAIGIDVRAQFAEMEDDDDDEDDWDDDENDDPEDDRWPDDTDEDEDDISDASDPTPRHDGGYWTDPNDPTS